MKLEDIYQFFAQPPIYLSCEQAVCYVLSVLLIEKSYGTRLIQKLECEYPSYCLSDTVLYAALSFLEDEKALASHWQKVEGAESRRARSSEEDVSGQPPVARRGTKASKHQVRSLP